MFEENDARGGPVDDIILAAWAASHNELGRKKETAILVSRLENDYPDFHLKSFRFLRFFERSDERQRLFELLKKTELSVDRPMTR